MRRSNSISTFPPFKNKGRNFQFNSFPTDTATRGTNEKRRTGYKQTKKKDKREKHVRLFAKKQKE
jgi:hypothetical protein